MNASAGRVQSPSLQRVSGPLPLEAGLIHRLNTGGVRLRISPEQRIGKQARSIWHSCA